MNKRIKKKQIKMENKRLCKRYPFLIPRNSWADQITWKYPKSKWHNYYEKYAYTELDAMPEGWRRAFGKQMCEEIREVLIKGKYLYDYRVVEVKEKFGGLRWYDNGAPSSIYKELQDIICKYEMLSYRTCIRCGCPATKISRGWVSPFCDKCAAKISNRVEFKEID